VSAEKWESRVKRQQGNFIIVRLEDLWSAWCREAHERQRQLLIPEADEPNGIKGKDITPYIMSTTLPPGSAKPSLIEPRGDTRIPLQPMFGVNTHYGKPELT
jgi:hypothetical protein